MNKIDEAENKQDNHKTNSENKILRLFLNLIREVLAILFWGYVITKLFIFDFDIFLINNYFPDYAWLITYKFFIITAIFSTIWLFTKNIHILLWTLYIFFYPIILVFWKVPHFLLKNQSWNLIFNGE